MSTTSNPSVTLKMLFILEKSNTKQICTNQSGKFLKYIFIVYLKTRGSFSFIKKLYVWIYNDLNRGTYHYQLASFNSVNLTDNGPFNT